MRAAKTVAPGLFRIPIRNLGNLRNASEKVGTERTHNVRSNSWSGIFLFGALFLVGYLGGVLKGRTGQSELGNQLAAYYQTAENFSAFVPLFLDLLGSAFLQATLVLACGFSAVGSGFLCLYFVARGAVMGLCAASVFVQGGTKALVVHWMLTCLPDLSVFLIMLWLAAQAQRCAGEMLRLLLGNGSHLRQTPQVRKLLLRFATALFLSVVSCVVGAASGVLFAGVLL